MSQDFEHLPEPIPQGERVVWQGKPGWRALALHAFHLRELAAYFAVLLVWYAVTAVSSHPSGTQAALATLRMAGIALVPLVLVCAYSWMCSRATLYMITDRRLVLRIGIVVPITINLPFGKIEAAGLRDWQDGSGNIALTLAPTERLAYAVLWPHAKPWRMARAEPALRCIPDAAHVAQILSRALAASAGVSVQAVSQTKTAMSASHANAALA